MSQRYGTNQASRSAGGCDSQRSVIRLADTSAMTVDREPDETGPFTKSEMDALKIHKALSTLRPFSHRSREEIMEFVCYMFEFQAVPGEQICRPTERNRCFYFIASGEVLHRRSSNSLQQQQQQQQQQPQSPHSQQQQQQQQQRRSVEQKLFELDCWGLESLFVGKDERGIAATATTPCRLFVLTARRFFWLCKASAQRSLWLQMRVLEGLAGSLVSVRRLLRLGGGRGGRGGGLVETADAPSGSLKSMDQTVDSQQGQQPQQVPAAPVSLKDANPRLLDRLLHAFRQVDVTSHRSDSDRDSGRLQVFCNTGQTLVVYTLTGSARLSLDHCTNSPELVTVTALDLPAGRHHEIGANQIWNVTESSRTQHHQTVVFLIKLARFDKPSSNAGD